MIMLRVQELVESYDKLRVPGLKNNERDIRILG